MNNRRTELVVRARAVRRAAIAAFNDFQHGDVRYKLLVFIGRYASHIAVVCVCLAALVLAGARLNGERASATAGDPSVPGGVDDEAEGFADEESGYGPRVVVGSGLGNLSIAPSFPQNYLTQLNQDNGLVSRLVVASTEAQAEERSGIQTYVVKPNDNVELIANNFGLQPSTLIWSNPALEEDYGNHLDIGQQLVILPVNGVYHTVKSGDTLESLAKIYKVRVEEIVASPLNNLTGGGNLFPGSRVVVPNGVKPETQRVIAANPVLPARPGQGQTAAQPRAQTAVARAATGSFTWPTVGVLTQNYSRFHNGLDIASSIGTPIRASDNGYVTVARGGWNGGYGNHVILDHRNGFSTLYGHMSVLYVSPGQPVARGQVIGLMGSTGRSTGPHVHFEIRYNGATVNPNLYLRR